MLRAQGFGLRRSACRMRRSQSTISRSLRRNAATHCD
ncbi:helix-turn-helix domain-containing protein [Nocardia ignorata]